MIQISRQRALTNQRQPSHAAQSPERLGAAFDLDPWQLQQTIDRPIAASVDKRVLHKAIDQVFNREEIEALRADVEQALADDGITLQIGLEVVGGIGKTAKCSTRWVISIVKVTKRISCPPCAEPGQASFSES